MKEKDDIQAIASKIKAQGFEVPAIFFLELCKPLRGMGKFWLEGMGRLLPIVVGPKLASFLETILESPEMVEELIENLEGEAAQHGH